MHLIWNKKAKFCNTKPVVYYVEKHGLCVLLIVVICGVFWGEGGNKIPQQTFLLIFTGGKKLQETLDKQLEPFSKQYRNLTTEKFIVIVVNNYVKFLEFYVILVKMNVETYISYIYYMAQGRHTRIFGLR